MKFYLFSIMMTMLLFVGNVNANNHQVIEGDSEYGKTLVESAFGRGCMGCHSIDKFKDASAEEILDRITASWHSAGYTYEDIRDISVYLSKEAKSK
ncbi:MAG: hypothetical protein CM1200mP17_03200 [Woeseia sp.]|jgi:hypothetical protein|nr:MAG: hypothetical protein CM1200mP17_03200 [Woeseia sp.]